MTAERLTVVSRDECALCEEMLSELAALGRTVALPPLEVLDVDADPQRLRRYGLHVPVLLLDDTVVCRGRLDRDELMRLLRARAPERAP